MTSPCGADGDRTGTVGLSRSERPGPASTVRGRPHPRDDKGEPVAATVADEVYREVQSLTESGEVASRAEAIRRVAEGLGKSVSAVSSAFYTGQRRARDGSPEARESGTGRRGREGHRGSPALYAEMLPLVEAGATVRQAARRFGGDADEVADIAAGFVRWSEQEVAGSAAADDAAAEARERIDALEEENRELRRALAQAQQTISRALAILQSAG